MGYESLLAKKFQSYQKVADDSSGERNFLRVQAIVQNCEIWSDLYVKETKSHQYVHSSFCHPYQYCDPTQYVPTVPFLTTVVTSKKIWLSYKNYEQEPVRDQVLKERAVSRETLLNNEVKLLVKDQLVHNLTCK